MKKKIIYGIVILLVIIQFIPINHSVPEQITADHFYEATQPSPSVKATMDAACMDCHSFNTTYPWYSRVAPLSWWIQDHINEGREHLNFAVWNTYSDKKKDHKLEELIEEVKEHEMPLDSYTWMHDEAKLTDEQRNELINWVTELRKN